MFAVARCVEIPIMETRKARKSLSVTVGRGVTHSNDPMRAPSLRYRRTTVINDVGQKQFIWTETWYCTRDDVFA